MTILPLIYNEAYFAKKIEIIVNLCIFFLFLPYKLAEYIFFSITIGVFNKRNAGHMKAQKKKLDNYEHNNETSEDLNQKSEGDVITEDIFVDEFEDSDCENREIDIDTDEITDDNESDNDALIEVIAVNCENSQIHEIPKPELRNHLSAEVNRFLKGGGQIEKIPMNKRANPPQKPASNYGRKSI